MNDGEVFLPNLAQVRFGRDHADTLATLLGCDVRTLAPQQRFQYRRVGSDPTQGYNLPDGRVALVRDRQMTAISDVVVWPDAAAWGRWRQADGRDLSWWQVQ